MSFKNILNKFLNSQIVNVLTPLQGFILGDVYWYRDVVEGVLPKFIGNLEITDTSPLQ